MSKAALLALVCILVMLLLPSGHRAGLVANNSSATIAGSNEPIAERRTKLAFDSNGRSVSADTTASGWSALPNKGLNGTVNTIVFNFGDMYVGGDFTATGDGAVQNLNGIAKFSGGMWFGLPNKGLNGRVTAIAFRGFDMYVGGSFTQTYDGAVKNLNGIARFDGSTWSPLPNNGLWDNGMVRPGTVRTIAFRGSDMYVGGIFNRTGDGQVTDLNYIAKFNGSTWLPLPNKGLSGPVNVIAFRDPFDNIYDDMYVGGQFTQSFDGTVQNLNAIAKFSGGAWSALPNGGLRNSNIMDPATVNAITVTDRLFGEIYVGGNFAMTYDCTQQSSKCVRDLWNIAKFEDYPGWSALSRDSIVHDVYALATVSDLYVGGSFDQAIYRFEKTTWSELPNCGLVDIFGTGRAVFAIAWSGTDVYVGGHFNQTCDYSVQDLNGIAKYTPPIQLYLDESGPAPDQIAAVDSVYGRRDPFPVIDNLLLSRVGDPNTRVTIFAANLVLARDEFSSSVVVNLVDSNNRSYDIAAEDVRSPRGLFGGTSQVTFRLADSLPAGPCTVKLKAHGQVSNAGTFRIRS